ncbi:GNAT family N-acetyltransferase [Streptomyces sp. NPDC051320]|uniref:GNAT family N-acetyltransferase n=1 Tax=Streptomyces sp. NPDC051320 TaxID=3154644 RepID=UPI003447ED3E
MLPSSYRSRPATADDIGVRHDHRGQGIARLLLRRTFRAFHRAGRRSCTLWTHSDTGALDLYLRVGMTVRHSSTVFRKQLRLNAPSPTPTSWPPRPPPTHHTATRGRPGTPGNARERPGTP